MWRMRVWRVLVWRMLVWRMLVWCAPEEGTFFGRVVHVGGRCPLMSKFARREKGGGVVLESARNAGAPIIKFDTGGTCDFPACQMVQKQEQGGAGGGDARTCMRPRNWRVCDPFTSHSIHLQQPSRTRPRNPPRLLLHCRSQLRHAQRALPVCQCVKMNDWQESLKNDAHART